MYARRVECSPGTLWVQQLLNWLGDYDITEDEVLGEIAPKANKLEQAKRLSDGNQNRIRAII